MLMEYRIALSRFKVYATGYLSPHESVLAGYAETREGADDMANEIRMHFPAVTETEIVEIDDEERVRLAEWVKRVNEAYSKTH
jgi:hypothetical protein